MVDLNIKLPNGFLDEEERSGYVVSHEMKKAWAVMLDLLAELDRVCKKHGIKYYAAGGTLLGAVRHKGFIPWDDDVDLVMFRQDYNRLMEIGPLEFRHPYFLQNKHTDPTACDLIAKLRNSETTSLFKAERKSVLPYNKGIFIDIFPSDNVPDSFDERSDFFNRLEIKRKEFIDFGRRLGVFSASNNSLEMFFKNISYCLLKNRRKKHIGRYIELIDEYEALCSEYNDEDTEFTASYVFGPQEELLRPRRDFEKSLEVDFEFLKIPICADYHHYLTVAYGNYMEFVKGTSWHSSIFFDSDKSYSEYTL